LLGGGTMLFVLAPGKSDARTPTVGIGPSGIMVRGQF
jgi:hypothetical protein